MNTWSYEVSVIRVYMCNDLRARVLDAGGETEKYALMRQM